MEERSIIVHTGDYTSIIAISSDTKWKDLKMMRDPSYYVYDVTIFQNNIELKYNDDEIVDLPDKSEIRIQFFTSCRKCRTKFNTDYMIRYCDDCRKNYT